MIFEGSFYLLRRQVGVDGRQARIGSCSALAQRGMAVPAGHKERACWPSPSEKVSRLFRRPGRRRRSDRDKWLDLKGWRIVVKKSEATPAGFSDLPVPSCSSLHHPVYAGATNSH